MCIAISGRSRIVAGCSPEPAAESLVACRRDPARRRRAGGQPARAAVVRRRLGDGRRRATGSPSSGSTARGKSTLLRQLAGRIEPEAGVGAPGPGRARRDARPGRRRCPGRPSATPRPAVGTPRRSSTGSASVAASTSPTATLSGGETKRVALARALVEVGPLGRRRTDDVLLILDEPTNHLDIDAIVLARGAPRRPPRRARARHPRPPRARPRRPPASSSSIGARATCTTAATPATSRRAPSGERRRRGSEDVRRNLARSELAWLRRGAPARTRKPKARIEAATAIVEGRGRGAGARRRARPRLRRPAARRHRRRAARRRPPLRRRPLAVPRRRAVARPARAARHRRPERRRQVDAARRHRRPAGAGGGDGRDRAPRCALGYVQPARHRARSDDAGRRRRWPARPGVPDWQDARFLERFWFDADAQRAPIGLLSGGERRRLQLVLTLRAAAQRAAARRADQRPRSRHAARARGRPRGLARRGRRGQPRPGLPRAHGRPTCSRSTPTGRAAGCRAGSPRWEAGPSATPPPTAPTPPGG